jgi:hypothetical protein
MRTCVVYLATACVNSLEQLVNLIVRHLLAQVCKDYPPLAPFFSRQSYTKQKASKLTISQLSNPNKTGHVLVKNLEAPTILLWLTGIPESAGPIQDAGESIEVEICAADILLEVWDFSERWVLTAGAEEVA